MDISELTQRLAAGASLSSMAISMLPAPIRDTLGRCAVARTFDADLYETVLRGDGGPPLTDLIDQGQVEPDSPGHYQVCEGLRDGAWESWWAAATANPPLVPDELRRFSATLAEVSHEAGAPLDELRHLLIANQARARELFVNLYEEADARLDLAACHNLIGVLCDPDLLPLLEPQTLVLIEDRQLHVQARSMWYLEHHQSTRYLGRRELELPMEEMVRGTASRVLQLHATGGMGKTMQLRWFIARYCVPRRIPCARLDFDVLDPINAVHHPWLLLLECARQLNRQMDKAPFTELLRDHGAYLTVLSHQHSEAARSGSTALGVAALAKVDQDDVRFRFARTLAERNENSPVFIVLDTLEEVILRSVGDPRAVLDTLADELDQLPCVRLVLSGRYDLNERVVGFRERFPGATSLTVGPFDDEQARRYLTEIRGVEQPALAQAVVRRAGGLPFTLAAFADLLRQDPDLTVEDLDQCDDPALLYAIERVVERIDDDRLQWLLRYGVVPRRLSFDFLRNVMWPYLVEGMAGTEHDRPDRDGRPVRRREVFRTGTFPDDERALDELWSRFITYASDYSWISLSGTEPDTVLFHDDVVRPLRQLLSQQPVFRALHEQAARFYTERAGSEQGRWLADIKDALYHRFQAGDQAAAQAWRDALGYARAQGAPDWEKELCRELLGRDYLSDDGIPLPNPAGEPMIGYQLVAEAHLRLARVVAEQARLSGWPGDHPEWSVVDTSLSDATRIAKQHNEIVLDPIVVAVVRASVLLARGQASEVADVIREYALEPSADSSQSRDAVLVFAEALLSLGETQRAIVLLVKAYELSRRLDDHPSAARVALSLSAALLAMDSVDEALRWASSALDEASTEPEREEAALAEALAALAAGRPSFALGQLGTRAGPRAEHLRSRAMLALRAPRKANDHCGNALDDTKKLPPKQLPYLLATSAEIHGELLEFETALDSLVQAIDMCRTVRDSEVAARWAAAAARLHFFGTGDLRETAQFLDEADGLKPAMGGDSWLSVRLLRAGLLDALGMADAADRMMDEALAAMDRRSHPPSQWVRVALAGLRLPGRAGRYFPLLLEHLVRIESPIRKLVLLGDLRHVGSLDGVGADDRKQLIELARAARASNSLTPDERAALGLIDAEIERLAGSRWTAGNILNETSRQLATHDPFVWWDWLRAMDRIGTASNDEPEEAMAAPAALRDHYPAQDTLYGAYLTLLVGRRVTCDPLVLLESQLDSADTALRDGSRRIHRMFARLLDVRAQLAMVAGDWETGHRLGASAWSILTELGHPTSSRVTEHYALAADVPVVPTSHEIAMTVELNDSTIRVIAARPDSAEVIIDQPTEPVSDEPVGQRYDMQTALADRPVSWAEDSPETKTFLRALKRVLARPTRLHLRLTLNDPRLHGLPWELVSLRAHQLSRLAEVRTCYRAPARELTRQTEVRLLQHLLTEAGSDCGPVDGLFGPLTQAGVRDFQTRLGLPATGAPDQAIWQNLRRRLGKPTRPVSVLVLQRSRSRSLKFQRGSEDLDVPLFYRFNNIAVSVLENPTPEQLERYTSASGKPDVVHIRAAMEAGRGTPYLDFAASLDYSTTSNFESRPERLYVTPLARFIQQVGRHDLMPLVILDIETPPVQQEAVRAMMLRNEFAHQLLALGPAQAILATGVGTAKEQEKMYHSISDGLRSGATAAQIAKRVHMLSHPGAAFLSMLPPEAQLPIGAM